MQTNEPRCPTTRHERMLPVNRHEWHRPRNAQGTPMSYREIARHEHRAVEMGPVGAYQDGETYYESCRHCGWCRRTDWLTGERTYSDETIQV